MAAQSPDDDHVPKYGTEAYRALQRACTRAVEDGDLAPLQQAGVKAIASVCQWIGLSARALRHGHVHVVAWLIEESERTGVDVARGWKLIHAACLLGDMDKLRAASDEDFGQLTGSGETALHAAAAGDQGDVVEYLVRERGADVHALSVMRYTALDRAGECGSVCAIEALVACGARLYDEPGQPCKALLLAAEHGHVAAMEKLVELGVDVVAVGKDGGVLHAAARRINLAGIDAAVRLGADPRAVDRGGKTVLHAVVSRADPLVVRRLVHLGVPLDAVDAHGQTALHLAFMSPDACRALLELGADRWTKDSQGFTARDVAVDKSSAFNQEQTQQVLQLLDVYFPIVPCMAQLLLGLRGPTESSLTRFAAHSAFEPKVLSLVNCLLTGKHDKAFAQLVSES